MGNKALVQAAPNVLALSTGYNREQVDLIKRTVAKGATDDELQLFLHYCKSNKADPFRKQAYFIVREYESKGQKQRETLMMMGIDGFRSRAEQQPDFLGITSGAVYDTDTFSIDFGKGEVSHAVKFPRKGTLIGAWARICRRDRIPYVEWSEVAKIKDEYGFQWKKDPEGMSKKTVEARAIRHEYPEPFSTTYAPEELGGTMSETGSVMMPVAGGMADVETGEVVEDAPEEGGSAPSEPEPPPAPVLLGPVRARKLEGAIESTGNCNHPLHLKAAIPIYCNGKTSLEELTQEEGLILLNHFKNRAENGENDDKAPETAQETPGPDNAHPGADQEAKSQSFAPGEAEDVLFPPDDAEARERYNDLVATAKREGIPMEAGKGVSLRKMIDECWPGRGDTDIWRISVEVYDRVDAKMTEVVTARKEASKK